MERNVVLHSWQWAPVSISEFPRTVLFTEPHAGVKSPVLSTASNSTGRYSWHRDNLNFMHIFLDLLLG